MGKRGRAAALSVSSIVITVAITRNSSLCSSVISPIFAAGATDIGKIGHGTKIPQITLCRWCHTWKGFPAWRPWPVDDRDRHLRIFRAEEEPVIREFIITNYVIPGTLFTNNDFRRIAMEAFLTKHAESEKLPEFSCSNNFRKISNRGKV
jgi:hypothetical protein